ncbi:MAG: magnesium transporter [Gammaproteobacteria bacterium]|nr:magnesium transporter [Gammaproteobacteria bacterium]
MLDIEINHNNKRKKLLFDEISHLINSQQLEEIPLSENQHHPDLTYSILHKQQVQRLKNKLSGVHPADIAYLLETLPQKQRLYVWENIESKKTGDILLELSDVIRNNLLSVMGAEAVLSATEKLDCDEIADLAPSLPSKVVQKILKSLNLKNRQQLEEALSYEDGTVGALMDFNMITIREDISLKDVLRYCQKLGDLPEKTHQMFVVDQNNVLKGSLPLQKLVATPKGQLVNSVMNKDIVSFTPDGDADKAVQDFDRYELISAPVVDKNNKLIGRLSVDNIIDYTREQVEDDMLNQAGLLEDEDLFSGVWTGAKNRWFWLAMNLATTFIATRVISIFEETIIQLVALATLMPVVAAVGGNTGNQTSMLIIRSLALEQINSSNIRQFLLKEIGISLVNGLIWGGIMACFVFVVYQNLSLGLVMMGAILLSLFLGTLAGITVPMIRYHFKLDPAMGTSVILTFIADSLGFFIFLGLAAIFL